MKHIIWVIIGVAGMLGVFFPGLSAAQPQYEEVIVNFVDHASLELIQTIAQKYGVTLEYNSIFSKEEALLRFPVGALSQEQLQSLTQLLTAEKEIEYAEPNYLYQAMKFPNDPMYAKQWNMNMLSMEEAWKTADGKGAVVAVIDTGVAFEDYKDKNGVYHRVPDLAQTAFVQGYDFIDDDEHANDDHGHGTHVAGTIAQSTHNKIGVTGIAYKASIMPLKVLNRYGYGNIADIAEAIVYAADHGAHVINMSLGGPGESQLMREAVEYAHKKGVTVVCAAGNESRNRASYPAAYPYALGVSSVGPDGELAPYSNYGKGIDIAAPGGNTRANIEHGILQNTIGRSDPTKDSYEYFQGTSMASPHVAGVAALLVSLGVKDPAKIEKILFSTAQKKDKTKYGAGIVNAAAAVQKAVDLSPAAVASPIILRESLIYFLAGIGFALVYFKLLKRSDGYGKLFSFLFSLAMFLSSSGLFFLDFIPASGAAQTVIHVLSSPIPNLDRVFFGYGAGLINPILHSALLPLALIVAFLGTKRLRWFAMGLAVGMASHFFVDAFFSLANVTYLPGGFLLDKAWLLANGIFCFGLAVLAGKKS
ncbi:peptidase, S8A (Subtilisin) family [Candidatus Vecturithrix granuli]|uniref:Peptidase, S8A (Subtilisin) family n=1 Tax=Vecturithrix granuli TaxID=1499967 RepID=A0A081BZA1_VECG1|nr:peptidase, S8A (Subtilisin) family [Candidatus Vecturithrix granuli]